MYAGKEIHRVITCNFSTFHSASSFIRISAHRTRKQTLNKTLTLAAHPPDYKLPPERTHSYLTRHRKQICGARVCVCVQNILLTHEKYRDKHFYY